MSAQTRIHARRKGVRTNQRPQYAVREDADGRGDHPSDRLARRFREPRAEAGAADAGALDGRGRFSSEASFFSSALSSSSTLFFFTHDASPIWMRYWTTAARSSKRVDLRVRLPGGRSVVEDDVIRPWRNDNRTLQLIPLRENLLGSSACPRAAPTADTRNKAEEIARSAFRSTSTSIAGTPSTWALRKRARFVLDHDRPDEVALVLVNLDPIVLVGDLPVARIDLVGMERLLPERDDAEVHLDVGLAAVLRDHGEAFLQLLRERRLAHNVVPIAERPGEDGDERVLDAVRRELRVLDP